MMKAALAAAALLIASTPVKSQTSPEEIRRLLKTPVDIYAAAKFAASAASYSDFCGGSPEFDGHAGIIRRLEFGSLGADDQEQYKAAMIRQYQSNEAIYRSLDAEAKKSFCSGLNSSMLQRSAEFVRSHPQLFETETPAPSPEPKSFVDVAAGVLDGFRPVERLYVVRVAENNMTADIGKLFEEPANKADGYLWVLKVMAMDYALLGSVAEIDHPAVAEAYQERAEIYARYVRGELSESKLKVQEKANEARKNAIYQHLLDEYDLGNQTLSKQRVTRLDAAAKELSDLVIGNAKAKSTN
jgi:hypothetical protein